MVRGFISGQVRSRRRRQNRRHKAALRALLIVTILLGTPDFTTTPTLADIQMSGISGRVVNEAGEPVVGVCIFRSPASAPSFQEYVYTAEDGSYFFGAQPGAYKLRFNDAGCGGDSRYAYRWSGNKSTFSDAEVVTVESGQTTDGVDIVLQPGGAISGTVVDNFGRPATSVRVETYDSDGYPAPGFATVDGTGLYTFGGLPTGDYKVYFVGGPQYTPEWYDDKPTRAQADPVHVTQPATTTGINVELQMSGISGRVVNEAGEPVVGVCIFRSPASAPSFQEYVYTAEDGSYFFGAQPGAYKLRFNDAGCGGDSRYAYRWSGNKSTFSDAEVVTVESGQTTDGVDIVLQPGARSRAPWSTTSAAQQPQFASRRMTATATRPPASRLSTGRASTRSAVCQQATTRSISSADRSTPPSGTTTNRPEPKQTQSTSPNPPPPPASMLSFR